MATTGLFERPLPAFRHIPAFRYDLSPRKGNGCNYHSEIEDTSVLAEVDKLPLSCDKRHCYSEKEDTGPLGEAELPLSLSQIEEAKPHCPRVVAQSLSSDEPCGKVQADKLPLSSDEPYCKEQDDKLALSSDKPYCKMQADESLPSDRLYCKVQDGAFPLWALEALDTETLLATREPSDGSEELDSPDASVCGSSKSLDSQCSRSDCFVTAPSTVCDEEGDEVELELPPLLIQDLEDAYDEAVNAPLPGGGLFQWSSMKDAARAAWAGGTSLLRYDEVLPRGAAKALARLREGAPDRPALALELGMGRGRLAMQIFLSGASVIGVEFASERYQRAVAASERLAHRRPEVFAVVKAQASTRQTLQLQNVLPGPWGGAVYEARRGDFFQELSDLEIKSATLAILQVHIPENCRQKICDLLSKLSRGCRILTRLNLIDIWQSGDDFPLRSLGRCRVVTSWAPVRGHSMYLWEKVG